MELSVKPLTLMSPGQPEITGGRISCGVTVTVSLETDAHPAVVDAG
jgi:hypothetical protein